jgi:hypothetical protein
LINKYGVNMGKKLQRCKERGGEWERGRRGEKEKGRMGDRD